MSALAPPPQWVLIRVPSYHLPASTKTFCTIALLGDHVSTVLQSGADCQGTVMAFA